MTADRFRPGRRLPVALAAVLAIALVVRLTVIARDALWLDEGYSWWDASQPFSSLWTLVPTCDPHPPLYFALLHGWIAAVGDGTVAMRALSTVFGLVTIAVVFAAGREIDRARGRQGALLGVGPVAALLFALTPFQVYFSVEARPYALLCLGAALLTLGCLRIARAVEMPSRRVATAWTDRVDRPTLALLLAGALLVVWTNNTAVLVLGAATVVFLGSWTFDRVSRGVVAPVLAVGAVVALLWAPDWPILLAQAREVSEDFWIPKPSFEGVTFELHNLIGLDVLRATWWVALAMAGGLVLVALRAGPRRAWTIGALAVLPIVFNVAISFAMKPILISRALMGAAPALALLLASSVVLVRGRVLRIVLVVALFAAHGLSLSRFLAADHVKEPWRPLVAALAIDAPDAPVLVVPNELVMPLAHEARMQHVPLTIRGLPADYPATDLAARYPSGKCAPSVIGQNLAPLLDRLRDAPTIVLLTRLHNTYDPADATVDAMRAAGLTLRGETVYQPGDLRVMRFVRGG